MFAVVMVVSVVEKRSVPGAPARRKPVLAIGLPLAWIAYTGVLDRRARWE
jgi:hypothetical protein